jgi:uncharacterized membrane protein YecN with MAPEG domain
MKIEDILEHNSLLEINEKTRISVANIEKIAQKDFSGLKRVQVLGLISILEREYGEAFTDLRQASDEYFGSLAETISIPVNLVKEVSSSRGQKWLIWLFGLILIVALWFFYSSLNQNTTQAIATPNIEETNITIEPMATEADVTDVNKTKEGNITSINGVDTNVTNTTSSSVKIVPLKRLWFAIVDLATKKVIDHSMTHPFETNTTSDILIVTSVAPFSMITAAGEKKYNDFKSHYFKVTKGITEEITKEVFISSGGPKNLTR